MKELILRANAAFTFLLGVVLFVSLSFAIEGNSPVQDWIVTAGVIFVAELAVWVGIGIGYLVSMAVSAPPMRRGYIRYSEKYGWTDEGGRRP